MEELVVSVICNAYNHELYISQCLDSIVMQKTSFPFEVLVHDDASTDKTASIIREYEKKYPELIKPIYQVENQYSKGGIARFQYPRIKGRYVAFCEGDDYWTDPLKLQKQFEVMEAHPELDICAHAAMQIDATTGKKICDIAPRLSDSIINVEDVILGEGGYVFVATNSLFYRSVLAKNELPFRKMLRLDYTMQIAGSLKGGMLYLEDYMSVYRYMTPGSWTVNQAQDSEKRKSVYLRKQEMLRQLDEDTKGAYSSTIAKRMKKNEFAFLAGQNKYKEMLKPEFRMIFSEMSKNEQIKIFIKAAFPIVYKVKRYIRNRMSR